MKNKKYYIILIFVLLTAGCTKDNPVENSSKDLEGNWTLVTISGGYTGQTSFPDENNTTLLNIKKDGTFTIYKKNKAPFVTKYEIKKMKTICSVEPTECIVLADSTFYPNLYIIVDYTKTNLVLAENCIDGYTFTYEKIYPPHLM